ncbi:MAG TPA: DnaB-like helicase N-terminal domain-containing protein, partial [Bryobacteraceae bacterium]|nr:DnaB-like helicase N-terminal domain-containing protein [Bryobacteraceae bacterium]
MATPDLALERGLPANLDAERFVLGAILLDGANYIFVAGMLEADDFSLEKHRRIFLRIADIHGRGEAIDRVTVANELMRHGQLESCDGLSYLVELDSGLSRVFPLEDYVRIVKEKSVLRRIIFASQKLIDRALLGEEDPNEILGSAEETLLKLGEAQAR